MSREEMWMNKIKIIESIFELQYYEDEMKAVIFDLDDVLYPLDAYVQSGFHQISRLFLGHSQEVYDELWDTYGQQRAAEVNGTDDAVSGAIHAMLQAQDMDSDEMAEKCLRIYEQHTPRIQPYDGIIELLEELREKGMRLGLLTDGSPEMQREKMRALSLIPLFDEIIITDDIAGHGDVMKFRTPNQICFEIMRLRLDVPFEKMGYVGCQQSRHVKTRINRN